MPTVQTFSVIICAYTEARWDDLMRAVESVQHQTLPPQELIVVVDHNPTLLARVERKLPGVIAVENQEARGLSGARNRGIAAAHAMIVAFLDDDAVAAPDWLEQLERGYTDPQVAAVGGMIAPRWCAGRPAWFPSEFDWVVGCTYRGMPVSDTPVRNLIGCNMSFRRSLVVATGGFRIGRVGQLAIGQEDDETEFCIRLAATYPGIVILYRPTALVHHSVRSERGKVRYFVRRCFSEGLSKAGLARMVGRNQGLATERNYTLRTLPGGVVQGIGAALTGRDVTGLLRAGAIIAGLLVTAMGYLLGQLRAPAGSATHLPATLPGTRPDIPADHPVSSSH